MNDDIQSSQPLTIKQPRRDQITAISSAMQRRPIVLVLGMHRNGTSLCSHILSALGVDMADKIPGPWNTSVTPDNPRGHWERWEIVEFHDRILSLLNRDYFGRFHDCALPVAWWADPRVVQIRREIVAFLEQRMGDSYFGFKDPRTVRLLPVWHQIFNELKLAPKIVLCLRNPAQVARSLNARDGLDPEIGEYRWLVHMIDFFRYIDNVDFCTLEYEEWFDNPSANIEKLQEFLDVPWQQSRTDLSLMLSGLIDLSARHDDPDHREANQPLVRALYKLTSRAGDNGGSRDQIASLVSQFISFQQLQRPFVRMFEDVAKDADKYSEIEQEMTALRTAVSERDAVVEATDSRASDAETRLAAALAEIEAQRAQIAGIEHEANELKATLVEREAALQRAEQEAQERGAAVLASQSEIAVLRDALARAEHEGQHRAAAAVTLETEVGALREMLARAEHEGQHRAAAADRLQREISGLRTSLARVESEAIERAAAAAAFQTEIVTIQDTLSAARQVGTAAVVAFRLDTRSPARPDGPHR